MFGRKKKHPRCKYSTPQIGEMVETTEDYGYHYDGQYLRGVVVDITNGDGKNKIVTFRVCKQRGSRKKQCRTHMSNYWLQLVDETCCCSQGCDCHHHHCCCRCHHCCRGCCCCK